MPRRAFKTTTPARRQIKTGTKGASLLLASKTGAKTPQTRHPASRPADSLCTTTVNSALEQTESKRAYEHEGEQGRREEQRRQNEKRGQTWCVCVCVSEEKKKLKRAKSTFYTTLCSLGIWTGYSESARTIDPIVRQRQLLLQVLSTILQSLHSSKLLISKQQFNSLGEQQSTISTCWNYSTIEGMNGYCPLKTPLLTTMRVGTYNDNSSARNLHNTGFHSVTDHTIAQWD